MANTFKFGNGNWAVKDGYALAYNDENGNFKPLPFDFTRASTATRVNKDGLIENVPSGKPRIDFLNNTSGHLLLEPSRTNYVPYSVFDADIPTGWVVGQQTGTYDHELVTFRGQSAIKHTQITAGRSYLTDTVTLSAGTTYTCSFYVDLENSGDIPSSEVIANVIFSDDTGDTSLPFGEINQDTGLVSFTFTTGTDTVGELRLGFGCSGATSTTNKPLIFSMPQIEAGSYATSYIPTSGSIETRLDEEANGAGNSQVFDNDTGVWFIDLERIGIQSGRAMMLANSSGSEQIRLHFDAPTGQIRFRDNKNGLATIGGNISMGESTRKKIALKIDSTTLKVFADGSQVGSNYTRPTAFDIHLMYASDDAFKLFDTKFYNTALSDSELQALTSN